MTQRAPERLELRQRMFLQSGAQRVVLWMAVLTIVVLTAVVLVLGAHAKPGAGLDAAAVFDAWLDKLAAKPFDTAVHALMLGVLLLYLAYIGLAQQRERLVLSAAGIEYRSPLPQALQFLRPGWSLAWSMIRSARLRPIAYAKGPHTVALELEGGNRKARLFPYQWVDPRHFRPLSPWAELRKLRAAATLPAMEQAIEESAVMQYLAAAAPQLRVERNYTPGIRGFALEKNRQVLMVVITFFVLVFYALADTFFIGHETYAIAPPLGAFAAFGAPAALAAALWMRRGAVPLPESVVVALLFGAAFGAAGYPAALRLNAFTDTEGLRTVEYRLTRERRLEPLVAGPPPLAFPRYPEYWAQFEPGSVHTFQLRRGGLGFYQLDMRPVEEALREFYRRR